MPDALMFNVSVVFGFLMTFQQAGWFTLECTHIVHPNALHVHGKARAHYGVTLVNNLILCPISGEEYMQWSLADLGGARPARAPPYGSRFFRFDMQNFWNVAASGVHGPPVRGPRPPPTGNPGSATDGHPI